MFELLTIILFIWISYGVIKLALKVTWGLAKILAVSLLIFSWPALALILIFAGSSLLLIPVLCVLLAFAILKAIL